MVQLLWAATAGLAGDLAWQLVKRLVEHSLLLGATDLQWVKLYPVFRTYLMASLSSQAVRQMHDQLLEQAAPGWRKWDETTDLAAKTASLPPYLRENLVYHLIALQRTDLLGSSVFFNGVNADSGQRESPLPTERLISLLYSELDRQSRAERGILRYLGERHLQASYALIDQTNLGEPLEAGWGVIVPAGEDLAMRAAVQPLIQHRGDQIGRLPPIFKYESGMSVTDFLNRYGVLSGLAQVDKVPYYLLILGDPARIPFGFQADLSLEYATGRLHFDDPSAYAEYVERVLAYEQGEARDVRKVLFWAPETPGDQETAISAASLVQPLFEQLAIPAEFSKRLLRGAEATKAALLAALAEGQPPALVFAAGHGLVVSAEELDRQRRRQGALVTQGWRPGEPVTPDGFLAGEDVSSPKLTPGLIHYSLASFSAGTAAQSTFGSPLTTVGQTSFVADLPCQLLRRGALAFIGHSARPWSYAFLGGGAGSVLEAYRHTLRQLLNGTPVGHALRAPIDLGIQLSSSLYEALDEARFGQKVSAQTLALQWSGRQQTLGQVILGDPAVRLRITQKS
jgi:hypothetical protein